MATKRTLWKRHYSFLIILFFLLSMYFVTIYYVDDILPTEIQPKLSLNKDPRFTHDHSVQISNTQQDSTSTSTTNAPTFSTIDNSKLEYCPVHYHNTQTFTKTYLQTLTKLRTNPPTKICNENDLLTRKTEWKRLDINKFPNNMLSYVNRCKVNIFTDNQEVTEMWTNNQTTYNHLYKCGGTTIWDALDPMQKDGLMNGIGIKYKLHKGNSFTMTDNEYYWDHEQYFYNYWKNNFMFTYIRDPVARSLSGYYELAVKDTKMLSAILAKGDNEQIMEKGINRYRLLMNHLLQKKCNSLNQIESVRRRKEQHVIHVWSGDPHIHPQMMHLLNRSFEWFPYNYIGNLTADFDTSFRMILDEFSDAYHENGSIYDEYVHWARNREKGHYGNVLSDDVVTIKDLSDDDMKMICEIYWIDYICLPFDIPKACNITDLFVQHYGDDVEYLDCYYV